MTSYFAPLRADGSEPLALDMQSLFLSGRVLPFGAKLTITHVFRSSEKSPVEVVYCFPLPRDASLVSFQISGEGFSISSRLEPRAAADKRYEEAIENGSLAAVTQQNLDGLVNLTVGNIRPGETVSVRLDLLAGLSLSDAGFRLRFPFTVAPCYHSRMRVSLDAPGTGTIELPDDVSGGTFLPPFHSDAAQLHKIGFDLQIEPAQGIGEIASPSHALRVLLHDRSGVGVKLSPDQDVPTRDLVLDVKRDWGVGQAWSDQASDDRRHFAVVVPSSVFGPPARTIRRVVFLLDRSGSMSGAPLKQARVAIESCLAKLSPEDQFGVVAFDNNSERFRETMLLATRENVDQACGFLRSIDARGGTELANGVEAATHLLAGSAGEIFVITDGQVSDTVEILAKVRKCEIRLFCLGIGSASQDRFLELLARQTGGVCRFVTPAERIDDASSELFAAIGGTVAAEVRIANANVQPRSAGPVFSGTPFVAFGHINSQDSDLELQWPQASWRVPLDTLGTGLEEFIEKLRGAKCLADLEARNDGSDESRRQILNLSEHSELASSEMSLVAVVARQDDQIGDVPKTKIVPVGMPENTGFESYFGRKTVVHADFAMARRATPASLRPCELIMGRLASGITIPVTPPRTPTLQDLLAVLRDAMKIVDDQISTRAHTHENTRICELLTMLAVEGRHVKTDAQKIGIRSLLYFLMSDKVDFSDVSRHDRKKWTETRKRLLAAWPELTNPSSDEPGPGVPTGEKAREVRPGISLEEALSIFQEWANEPGNVEDDHNWLILDLDWLRTRLSDPITINQAMAMSDVLRGRHEGLLYLWEWILDSSVSWTVFFILSECYDPAFDPKEGVSHLDLFEFEESENPQEARK
jgi:Ca-activated chloride channel family protein